MEEIDLPLTDALATGAATDGPCPEDPSGSQLGAGGNPLKGIDGAAETHFILRAARPSRGGRGVRFRDEWRGAP